MRRPVTRDTGDQADGPDGADAVGNRERTAHKPTGPLAVVRETAVLVVLAVLLAVVFKTFLIQAFYIPSGSMEPTLDISDRVLVEKVSYRFGHVEQGDVIVFVHNDDSLDTPQPNLVARFFIGLGQAVGVTPPSDRDFIKRVVGVPGDKLSCSGGRLFRNGAPLAEPYVQEGSTTDCTPVTVPDGKLYVMGDNRNNSQDSRVFGAIDRSEVVGRAFVRIWPFGRAGWLRRDQ
jgi:signal peptidase I